MGIKRTKNGFKLIGCLLILISLIFVFFSVGITNSYFTSGKGLDVHTTININNLNLKVYQVLGGDRIELTSQQAAADTPQTYIKLEAEEILPDEEYNLNLVLKNDEVSNNSLYLRYKIEFFAVGYDAEKLINVNIKTNEANFIKEGNYYYYKLNSNNAPIEADKEANLINSFSIPYEEFLTENFNANTIKIVLTIEGYLTSNFS